MKIHPKLEQMLGEARYRVYDLAREKMIAVPPEKVDLVLVGVMKRRFEKCLGELWDEVISEI